MKTLTRPGLTALLCTALFLWGLSCFLVNGPAIFVYVGLQAVTSGIFAYAFYRTEKSLERNRPAAAGHQDAEQNGVRPTVRVQPLTTSNPATSRPAENQRASV